MKNDREARGRAEEHAYEGKTVAKHCSTGKDEWLESDLHFERTTEREQLQEMKGGRDVNPSLDPVAGELFGLRLKLILHHGCIASSNFLARIIAAFEFCTVFLTIRTITRHRSLRFLFET